MRASRTMTVTSSSKRVTWVHPKADDFESRGLTSKEVQSDHIITLENELKRERDVNKSLQKDVAMLRG